MYKPDSLWTWSFLIVALIQAIVVLALEAYAFAIFQEDVNLLGPNPTNKAYTRTVPVMATVYLFGMLYFLILVWDALRMRNTIQLIGLCLGNLCLMIFGAAEPKQVLDAIHNLNMEVTADPDVQTKLLPVEIVIPCVLFVGTILMSFIARKLYDEFSWSIYKHISADLRMKQRYLTYQIYIALMKFDFYFFLGFAMQLLVVAINENDPEFWLTIAAVPVVILLLMMSGYWVRRENMPGMIIVIVIYVAGLVYYFFKLVRIWSGDKVIEYAPIAKELTIFAVITILLIIGSIVNAVQCMMNFGKGLRPYLLTRKQVGDDEKAYNTEMPNLAHTQAPTRMTID